MGRDTGADLLAVCDHAVSERGIRALLSTHAKRLIYQGAGNNAESVVFGRIAGENAAKLERWDR